MIGAIIGIILIWNVVGFVSLLLILSNIFKKDDDFRFISPNCIYYQTNMNYFGCICTSIFLALLCPIFFIITFTNWLFHVGRKKNE